MLSRLISCLGLLLLALALFQDSRVLANFDDDLVAQTLCTGGTTCALGTDGACEKKGKACKSTESCFCEPPSGEDTGCGCYK